MGGLNQKIVAAAIERGEQPPRTVADEPELWTICVPYWQAFQALTHSRPVHSLGMGGAKLGHIAYTELSRYANDHDYAFTIPDLDDFVFLVQRMDDAFITIMHQQQKANAPRTPTTTTRK